MIFKQLSGKKLFVITALLFIAVLPSAFAQRSRGITIDLASSLPRNSPWGRTLDRIAADWARITNGEVNLHILHQYPGSEGSYLMKLRQNKIQGAIFTSIGLNAIAPEVLALSIPFFIKNNDELDVVLKEVKPVMDARIEDEGYINMALVKAGWIKVFSRSPVYVPADLRKLKLASSPDEQALMDAFKAMGFQVVGANLTEVPQQLNAGRLDAVYMSPIAVNATQLYRVAKNMSTIAVAPFMGGILMNKVAWQRIPEKYRGELMEASRKAADEIENSFMKSEEDSIRDMKAAGIVINEVSPQQEQEWYNDIGQYLPDLVNRNVFDKKTYEQIRAILARYRGNR